MTTRTQRAIAKGVATLGTELGLGGSAWTAYAPTGDGERAAVSYAPAGTWAGYVRRAGPTRPGGAAAGAVVAVESWIAHGASNSLTPSGTLITGYILVSQADATRAYLVGSPVDVAGYVRWQVTPCAAPGGVS